MSHPEFSISVGGSIIIPEQKIRIPYVRQFTALIREQVSETHQRTSIITGGGGPTREYQNGLKELGVNDSTILDTIGIRPTHINAMFVSYALNNAGVRAQYLARLQEPIDHSMDAWITGGTVPGQTTDAVLVDWSQSLGFQTLINATNTPYIYEVNSGKIDKNKPIKELTWDEYLNLLGNRVHKPGENVPFGITAAHKAKELGLSVVVLDGNNLENLKRVFKGKSFAGTVIHPDHGN